MATDFRGEDYHDRFLSSLVSFVAGESFQTMFEEFFVAHALEFTNDKEHKLRYYEIYQDFHDMFERQLEVFCADLKITQPEFMRRCKEATTDDPKAKHYIDILLSSVEYETFVKLMKMMRPLAAHRLQEKADAKSYERDKAISHKGHDGGEDYGNGESKKAEAKYSESKAVDSKSSSK